MSHTPGDLTTNDELLRRINKVGEHLGRQDARLLTIEGELRLLFRVLKYFGGTLTAIGVLVAAGLLLRLF